MKIKNYRTNKTIDGYKLGPGLRDKTLIALPEAKLPGPTEILRIYIKSLDGCMYLKHSDLPSCAASLRFRDKWGRGAYTLCYFEVKINDPQLTFNLGG